MLVGIEACGYTQWFEQMLEEMGHRYQIGDAAAIRASGTAPTAPSVPAAEHLTVMEPAPARTPVDLPKTVTKPPFP